LTPESLSEKFADTIRVDLNMEMVGVFAYDNTDNSLHPFFFSKSDRLRNILAKLNIMLRDIKIDDISKNELLNKVIHSGVASTASNFTDIWLGVIDKKSLDTITNESHVKNIIIHPLITPNRIVGMLVLGLNRDYDSLNNHEKEAFKSFIDVISVALDKAYLYKELQDANVKLASLDKLKTEFLGLASHQLRSPLTAIKGYISMVLEGDYGEINKEIKEICQRVFESSKNLGVIVEDLLNVSKIEQGGMKYDMERFDLKEISSSVVKDLSIVAAQKNLKVNFELEGNEIFFMNGDKEKMRQVIINLIDNSIKYTKVGEINVALKKIGNKIHFIVKDTGMGMTPEIKESLFQKFSRGEGARMNASGSGLGLYLVRKIVEAHHGRVWVDSDGPDKGSTFSMELDAVN
jgi:signal transduction histidine kinase